MDASVVEREWSLLTRFLPEDWRELASRHGALRRAREIKDADTLLRLLLLHVAAGLSLRQTVVRARNAKLASVSDVALLKRLRASEPWLRAMTERMMKRTRYSAELSARWKGRRVRVVDATDIEEPGATGTSWRVHYCLQLPTLECDFFEVSSARGGETFRRLPVSARDVVLGDRGYAHREGVAHIVHHHGDVVVRLTRQTFPLLDAQAQPLEIVPTVRSLREHEPGQWDVSFEASSGRISGRLCAVRKSFVAAERAKARALAASRKKGKAIQQATLEAAEYVFVFTTLPDAEASASDVLELYRARWQIELAFKRLKSLLHAGHVPKYDPASARAWIQAKLLTVLLIERLIEEAGSFSPWGFGLAPTQPLARVHRGT